MESEEGFYKKGLLNNSHVPGAMPFMYVVMVVVMGRIIRADVYCNRHFIPLIEFLIKLILYLNFVFDIN
ncbi:MAG: hypothetical protein BGO14_00710 [Chlamydiales bacterium 38-26]|nr:MAG: hypothetical protein BGO14_00710 [Chlamydiales bacterium 38-26]